ncbi:hypothetical protein EVAR_34117_1 [Eumeta japonica]|uniref:Uncharacterized protein n=1 Tax=Eumeta variegata TaxID=151549 RepID=A0A4C1WJC1_EUMVA|nr:hypothetical protein EVAR_34117_1 [Eumeta japonica]
MSSDVESFLSDYLRTTHFSIQLDESTLPGNEALLLAYVRFVTGEEIHEELRFVKTLKTDTKGIHNERLDREMHSCQAPLARGLRRNSTVVVEVDTTIVMQALNHYTECSVGHVKGESSALGILWTTIAVYDRHDEAHLTMQGEDREEALSARTEGRSELQTTELE